MANEIRRLYNFFGGEVQENPLAASATTMTNPAFVALPAVASTEYVPVVFDPDGIEGAPFVKWVTAHTALSDTVTITAAGQEGTTERQVSYGIPFVLAATRQDLPAWVRQGGSATDWSASGTTTRALPAKTGEQFGAMPFSGLNSGATVIITFPTAFAYPPLCLATASNLNAVADTNVVAVVNAVTTTTLTVLIWSRTNLNGLGGTVNWIAKGELV